MNGYTFLMFTNFTSDINAFTTLNALNPHKIRILIIIGLDDYFTACLHTAAPRVLRKKFSFLFVRKKLCFVEIVFGY